jgi:hypothetical protein
MIAYDSEEGVDAHNEDVLLDSSSDSWSNAAAHIGIEHNRTASCRNATRRVRSSCFLDLVPRRGRLGCGRESWLVDLDSDGVGGTTGRGIIYS